MTVRNNTTKAANMSATPREIDFVTQFALRFQALLDILGVSNVVEKQPGSRARYYDATVTLNSSTVQEGDETPLSIANVVEKFLPEMELEPFAKATTAKAIKDYGYDIAVGKTDEAFRNELLRKVTGKFYNFLKQGTRTSVQTTFQMALAIAKGYVDNEFKMLNLESNGTVGFVNTIDFSTYLGGASVTVQTLYGMQYVQNFLGYDVIFLCSDNEVARSKVYATAKENLIAYYIDPSNADFAKAGLEYVTDGVTNFVGFHTEGNYGYTTSDCYAIMGLEVSAEYVNGIAAVTVEASGSIGSITASTTAGTAETGDSVVTITTEAVPGGVFYWYAKASSAPTAPTYLTQFDPGTDYKVVKSGDTVSSTNGHKYRIVEVNGTGQVIATCDGTVAAKTAG